jgi:hypothetical protein
MQKVDKGGRPKAVAGFNERRDTAAAAKKALLETWRANKIDVTDPAYLEQQALRQAAAAARAEREALRKAEKEAAKAQIIADRKTAQLAAEAKIIADQQAEQAAKVEAEAARIAREAEAKAARDARYAARKARK